MKPLHLFSFGIIAAGIFLLSKRKKKNKEIVIQPTAIFIWKNYEKIPMKR